MEGDRSLRQLKATLESTHGFDRVHFVEAVRNLVTQRFAQTFNRLTELFPGDRTMLPASSLPSIYLPQSSEAMKFMTRAAYRGKIVLNMEHDRVRTLPPRAASFSRRASTTRSSVAWSTAHAR